MAYVDAQFNVNIQETVVGGGPHQPLTLGTSTASATQTTIQSNTATSSNGLFLLPRFFRPTDLTNVQVYCSGAATGSGVTGMVWYFSTLNTSGTQTVTTSFGTTTNTTTITGINPPVAWVTFGTSGTSSVSTIYTGTMASAIVGSNGVSTNTYLTTATNVTPVMVVLLTATASGTQLGSYAVDFEFHPVFIN